MKLFGSTKKSIDKTMNGENVVYRYQRKSEVLYPFTPNKSYAYLLNVEPSNLVFLKTYNTQFDEIIIIFTNQNCIRKRKRS